MKYALLIALFMVLSLGLFADETLDIAYKPSDPTVGHYANAGVNSYYCIAIWLVDSSGNFVRTIDRWAGERWHSLRAWEQASGFDTDAVSGATVTDGSGSFPVRNLNGVDISDLPDGVYSVKIEVSDMDGPGAADTDVGTFTFTKGVADDTQSGLSNGGITNVTIDYTGRSGGTFDPGVYAGPDMAGDVGDEIALAGIADDPDGDTLTISWVKTSGPGTAYFADAAAANTTAAFSLPGVYVLTLSATAGTTVADTVTVYVSTMTIPSSADNQMNVLTPGTPSGIADVRHRVWDMNSPSVSNMEGIMKFSLASVPGTVVDADLLISPNDFWASGGINPVTRTIEGIGGSSDSWSAATITYNLMAALAGWGTKTSMGTFTTDAVNFGYPTVSSANLNTFVDAEHQGDQLATFRMYRNIGSPESDNGFRYNASFTSTPCKLRVMHNTAGTIEFVSAVFSVGEGDGTAVITVRRRGGSLGAASANYSMTNGSAGAGDYTNTSGSVNFADGVIEDTFTVAITQETDIETDETVNLLLSGGSAAGQTTATLTIVDDDNPGEVAFTSAAYFVAENGGAATITVTRSGGANGAASVNYATSDGTGVAGTDYTAASGTINPTWADGEFGDRTFTITIADDTVSDGSKTVNLTLSVFSGAAQGAQNTAVLTITDNEVIPGSSSSSGGCLPGAGFSGLLMLIVGGFLFKRRLHRA